MRRFLAVLLFIPCLARAEFETGNSLLSRMQSTSVGERMHALGYIKGVVDVYLYVTICPPGGGDNVTAGQIQDMIRNYLENMPAIRHKTAESIINDALKKVWPCPQRGGRGA